ncbi:hypothetical protein J2T13_001561 [Paenibacillus sp. DS2015]|uniref:hypothetical protein n=1 Tax=Paenibacillus sp. DS2015 TaxID=3373917 RepID=UPI003D1E2B4A
MQNSEKNVKKIIITVNGEPVGNGILIDTITYAPIKMQDEPSIHSTKTTNSP